MKKLIIQTLLLVAVLFCSESLLAQTAEQENVEKIKVTKIVEVPNQKFRSYLNVVPYGVCIGWNWYAGVEYSYGYQFSKYSYLGVGAGVTTTMPTISIPLFLNYRVYLNQRELRPYFDMQLGYNISLLAATEGYRENKISGEMFDLTFGLEYKRWNFALQLFRLSKIKIDDISEDKILQEYGVPFETIGLYTPTLKFGYSF
ncbi:MAG: hypothetical protein R3Y59_04525 [bacterium]